MTKAPKCKLCGAKMEKFCEQIKQAKDSTGTLQKYRYTLWTCPDCDFEHKTYEDI